MNQRLGGVAVTAALCAIAACGGGSSGEIDGGRPDGASRPDARAPDASAPDAIALDAMPLDAATGAPGPVTNLTATPGSGGHVDLAWTNPTDASYAGTIIVRHLIDPVDATPTTGTLYNTSDPIAAGDVVVYAGTGASFQDTAPPGRIHYAAFARDTLGNWSTPAAVANALVAAGAETATLTIAVATPGVTVTQQPADYVLAGTAAYDGGTQTLTVQLTATSGFARNVFSPKAEITAIDQGTVTGDGTLDGNPFVRFGTGIAPGGNGAATLTITGVDGSVDPVHVNLGFVDHPMAVIFPNYSTANAYELFDTGTLTSMGTVACDSLLYVDPTSQQGNNCSYRAGGLSADARRLYTGHRSLPVVRAIDPATNQVVATVTLDTGMGGVRAVALDPAGTHLYALLTIGGHALANTANGVAGPTVDQVLVKIDPATMTETSRVTIVAAAAQTADRLADLAVSPDGSKVAIADRTETTALVHLVDTATMTEIDTDAATAGVQPVDLSSLFANHVRRLRYSPSGATLYVQDQAAGTLATVDTATYAIGSIAITGTADNSGGLFVDTDGKIYVTYQAQPTTQSFTVIDGATQTPGPILGRANAIAVSGGRVYVAMTGHTMHVYDAGTLTEIDTGGGAPLTNQPAHDLLFTPF